MADLSISITVTGSMGGQSFTWSRTATVGNIDDAVYGLFQTKDFVGSTESGSGSQAADGIYSYSGAAVMCVVHTNPGTVCKISALCSDGTARGSFLVLPFVPMIYYNGAGTGFTGGLNASNTSTDTPTIDITAIQSQVMMGSGSVAALIGLKSIS